MKRLCAWAAVALALAAGPSLAQEPAGVITFQVDHVDSDAGHVRVDICPQDHFLKGGCPYKGAAPAVKGLTTVRVEGVPPGVYAAQVFHDRNDNERVDRLKLLGLPTEQVGFSNNAPVGLHGPRWSAASFTHEAGGQELAVRLRSYLAPPPA